jgi:hypothetical protein
MADFRLGNKLLQGVFALDVDKTATAAFCDNAHAHAAWVEFLVPVGELFAQRFAG